MPHQYPLEFVLLCLNRARFANFRQLTSGKKKTEHHFSTNTTERFRGRAESVKIDQI